MDKQDDPGLVDLHELSDEIAKKSSRARFRDESLEGFKLAATLLAARQNYQGAIEVLAYEQALHPNPPASFFARLAEVFERRGDQLAKASSGASSQSDLIKHDQQVRDLRTKAGDAYIAYSRCLTLIDDKGYGDAMWRGIDLYDQAANAQRTIAALELFVAERPGDPLAPDALLRLGGAYQAAGMFDKAVGTFQRNQFRYPQSLAASKSAVPLAQAYIAKGPEDFGKAEKVLLSVVENNPLLAPESEEFRAALFELAQLYYRTDRFEDSVNRLEEFVTRYPNEEKIGQLMFLMGDSYRKSAGALDLKIAGAGAGVDPAEASNARKDRLTKAKSYYDKAIEIYRAAPPKSDIDKVYYKLAHFYRADCLYDLGQYAEAIQLYDTAAFRYQDDPSALAAYVQIVNAYCALGKIPEAKTANERAKWLLRRIPPEAFKESAASVPKQYYEQWLQWTSDAGLWSAVEK
jgi:tetratricopeptide (TPR) repeat protein